MPRDAPSRLIVFHASRRAVWRLRSPTRESAPKVVGAHPVPGTTATIQIPAAAAGRPSLQTHSVWRLEVPVAVITEEPVAVNLMGAPIQ
jgi:hypothetical protein